MCFRQGKYYLVGWSLLFGSVLWILPGILPVALAATLNEINPCSPAAQPLIFIQEHKIQMNSEALWVGEWQLPPSASQPDSLTEARFFLELQHSFKSENWNAVLHFSFPDPKPLGIPFSFQRVELSWASSVGPVFIGIDWSNQCSDPGRSLFPHQSWETTLELPQTHHLDRLERFKLKLWGERN